MTRVGPETTIEQVSRYFESRASFRYVELWPVLQDTRRETLSSLKTDTHGNEFGAYRASSALAAELTSFFPAVQPAPESRIALHRGDRRCICT